ncbi:MAG: MATE family efflux transporter [Rikenellaceae bacterium]
MDNKSSLVKGNVQRQMLFFAVPMIITQLCQQVYQLTDTIIVGRYLGDSSLAAVGVSAPFVFLFIALAKGVSMGSSIIVSQNWGSGNMKNVKVAANSLYLFIILFSLFVTAVGLIFSENIMNVINLPDEIFITASEYFNIYLVGLIFLFLSNAVMGLLIGIGNSMTPMIFVALSVAFNIILDILFVVVFGLGVCGVAWATVITQGLVTIAMFIYTNRKLPILGISIRPIFDWNIFNRSMRLGLPTGFQQVFVAVGMVAIMGVINNFGVDVIAGYVAASRVEGFVMVVPLSLASALTAFVAQNYGAGDIKRVEQGIFETLKISFVSCFVVLMLLSVFGTSFMRLFTNNPNVINIGNQYLFIIGLTFTLFSVMFVYMGALRGVGNTIFPMVTTLFTLCVLKIPVAYFLSSTPLHELGIWLASPISWLVGVVVSIAYWYFVQLKKIKR